MNTTDTTRSGVDAAAHLLVLCCAREPQKRGSVVL